MIHCLTLGIGIGLTIRALFDLWVISRGVGPTIGDLFKIAVLFVAMIAIAVRRQRELCARVQIYLQRDGQSHDVVGRGRARHLQAERLGGLQINQAELGRVLDNR